MPFVCFVGRSVSIVSGLIRSLYLYSDVVGLFLRELRELHAKLAEMQSRHFLIELLRQDVDAIRVVVRTRQRRLSHRAEVQIELRQRLVRERR